MSVVAQINSEDIRRKRRLDRYPIKNYFQVSSMYYVYIIKSAAYSDQIYVGYTSNLKQRLETHNSGGSVYTAKHRPWKLITCIAFDDMARAKNFEWYLKSASGKSFAKKRLW